MSDRAQMDIIKHRGVKQWTLEIPVHIPNEDQIVRKGTREVDHPVLNDDRKFGFLLISLCLFFIVGFVALTMGAFDWIWELLTQ